MIAVNLAIAAAAGGARTLLVAADAASGLAARLVTRRSQSGVIDIGGERRALHRVDPVRLPTLHLAALGPPDGAAARSGLRLSGLARNFDVIIYDGPESCAASAPMLARAVDAVVLADAGGAPEEQFDLACDDLGLDGARLLGFVLTAGGPAPPAQRAKARRAA